MALEKIRFLTIAAMLGASAAFGMGCAVETGDEASDDLTPDQTDQAITDVKHTPVERQSIGNCWLYAEASWVESMNIAATGDDGFDVSQSYWTLLALVRPDRRGTRRRDSRPAAAARRRTRSSASTASCPRATSSPPDADDEMSARQASALAKINEALKNGVLKDLGCASRPRARPRASSIKAWELAPTSPRARQVFGRTSRRTLQLQQRVHARARTDRPRAKDFTVAKYTNAPPARCRTRRLSAGDRRVALRSSYPDYDALAAQLPAPLPAARCTTRSPVVITWFVDFNAMERDERAARSLDAAGDARATRAAT